METWRDKAGKAKRLFEDAKAVLNKTERGGEDVQEAYRMIAEAKELQAEATALKSIEDGVNEATVAIDTKERKPTEGKGGFERWGHWLYQTWRAGNPNIKEAPDSRLVYFADEGPKSHDSNNQKDMSGQTGEGGGFLIPAEFQATLLNVQAEQSLIRSRATIIPMRRRQLDIPVLDQTGTTAGQPHWFGGLKFYWAEEAAEKTASDPKFKQISLVAHKLIGFTRASDELLDDSAISLEAFLSGPLGFAGGVSWMEDWAFLRGTGAGMPLGVINAGATIVEGRAAANAFGIDDAIDMLEHFMPTGSGLWLMSQSVLPSLYGLNGPAGNPSYVWIPNARDGAPGSLFGYPVKFSEKPPILGTRGDVGIYDFRYYLVGDRQATTVESTRYERWQYDQTSWRVVHRVDGQPWLSAPLTLQDGTTQISPFVILGEAVGS